MKEYINYKDSICNRGNLFRLKSVFKKASRGEEITVGFIGGSITQGSLASSPSTCYAWHVYSWWMENFPKTDFKYVNAGIGGTTSQFGVARVQEDLLESNPDFVVVEFSVNDESDEHFLETYEGLVRKIFNHQSKPAILLVSNVYYNNGANAQVQHGKVSRYYDLPHVSMQSSIYPAVVLGNIDAAKITPDSLHPNDEGHELVASVITYFLDRALKEMLVEEPKSAVEDQLLEPITANSYENSKRYNNKNCNPRLEGFEADESIQEGVTDCFKNGWEAIEPGSIIIFTVDGTGVAIQYRRTVKGIAPRAKVIVDGAVEGYLDGTFDETWGDGLVIDTIFEHRNPGKHQVEIEIVDTNDAIVPFYLVSVIVAN